MKLSSNIRHDRQCAETKKQNSNISSDVIMSLAYFSEVVSAPYSSSRNEGFLAYLSYAQDEL